MKKIAIVFNSLKDNEFVNTKRVINILKGRAQIYIDEAYSDLGFEVNYVKYEQLFEYVDLMIVLGGDGTILQIATMCAKNDIPVLGVNLGRIGFMTEAEPDNIEDAIDAVLNDDYKIESRMLIKTQIVKKDKKQSFHALNDIVVSKNTQSKLINVELYADDELVNKYIADGLIIATPTGSTGYSISAGGPVVDPNMQLYIATPICPHMLSVRSAVLPAEKKIVIRLNEEYRDNYAVVAFDGDVQETLDVGDEIIITKSKYEFKIIKVNNFSFFDALLHKLP